MASDTKFVKRYAKTHAYRILERIQSECLDKEIIIDYSEDDLGSLVKYSYRLRKEDRFTTWFHFSCITCSDVTYMLDFMTKVRETWVKYAGDSPEDVAKKAVTKAKELLKYS